MTLTDLASSGITVYVGSFIDSESSSELRYIENGSLAVDNATGSIIYLSTTDKVVDPEVLATRISDYLASQNVEIVSLPITAEQITVVSSHDNPGSFFFPGFVDTHIHAPQFPNTGIFGDSTLLDWLEKYTFPMESSFHDTDRAKDVYSRVIQRTLSHGTTTASYYATVHVEATKVLAKLALEANQRAFVGRVCMDSNSPDYYCDHSVEHAKQADLEIIDYIQSIDAAREYVSPILTPRFAPSCSKEIMKWQAKTMDSYSVPCQTHISENTKEIAWIAELFPECSSYADVYDSVGLLKPTTILAHAVHLDASEKELIALRKSGISHCPVSNSCLGSGIAPVKDLMSRSIKVGLGTDASGGYSPSILENAKQALTLSRLLAQTKGDDFHKLSVPEVLFLATLGGAQVCGLDSKIGSFVVGKKWDAQLVNVKAAGSNIDEFDWHAGFISHAQLRHNVEKWLFNGDDRNTTHVWVNGRLVLEKPQKAA